MIYFNYKMCIKREKGAENALDHRRVKVNTRKRIEKRFYLVSLGQLT